MKQVIADYMENGFLDNIIAMFRHDAGLYQLIGGLLGDERSRVRIGTVALVEALKEESDGRLAASIPSIALLLQHANPTIRGDAAYVLGIIGHRDALPYLQGIRDDDNEMVTAAVREAVETITGAAGS